MANLAILALILLADAPANNVGSDSPNYLPIFLLVGLAFVFYFLMVMPQQRERKRWNDMVGALKKNDRVLMSCGIIGKVHVVSKDKNEIVVKVDDDNNTKMTFSLATVARILDQSKDNGDEK